MCSTMLDNFEKCSYVESNNNLENESDGPFIPGRFGGYRLGGYLTGSGQAGNEPMVMTGSQAVNEPMVMTGSGQVGNEQMGVMGDYIMETDRDWMADSNRLDIINDNGQDDINIWENKIAQWDQSRIVPNRTQVADRVQVIVSKKPENSVIVSPPHLHQLLFN